MSFTKAEAVRAVSVCDRLQGGCQLKFLDRLGNELYQYNPRHYAQDGSAVYPIAVNEEPIGVYGIRNDKNWLTSFGLLIKVRHLG